MNKSETLWFHYGNLSFLDLYEMKLVMHQNKEDIVAAAIELASDPLFPHFCIDTIIGLLALLEEEADRLSKKDRSLSLIRAKYSRTKEEILN